VNNKPRVVIIGGGGLVPGYFTNHLKTFIP
jgi:hypothetical protein